jgi:hypothetical protein
MGLYNSVTMNTPGFSCCHLILQSTEALLQGRHAAPQLLRNSTRVSMRHTTLHVIEIPYNATDSYARPQGTDSLFRGPAAKRVEA